MGLDDTAFEVLKKEYDQLKEELKHLNDRCIRHLEEKLELRNENEKLKQELEQANDSLKGKNWLDGKTYSISGLLKTIKELKDKQNQREQERLDKYVCAAMTGLLANPNHGKDGIFSGLNVLAVGQGKLTMQAADGVETDE